MNGQDILDLLNTEESGVYARDLILKNSEQIRKADFDLKETHNFKTSTLQAVKQLISRENIMYYGIMIGEEQIAIENTAGNVKLSILNKEQIVRKLKNIKEKDRKKISYVHIATIQTIFKSLFMEGIDSPIELELRDDRLKSEKDSVIARGAGNLAHGRIKFDINLQIALALADKDLDRSITIKYKLNRTDFMKEGNHPFTIAYRINYALTNSNHSIEFKSKEKIEIDDMFKSILTLERPISFEERKPSINSRLIKEDDIPESSKNQEKIKIEPPLNLTVPKIDIGKEIIELQNQVKRLDRRL